MHFVYLLFKLDLRASENHDGKKLPCQAEVSELQQQRFEYKQKTLVTQETRKADYTTAKLKIYLRINICPLHADMTKFGDYSIGIAQIDDENKQKIIFCEFYC